MKSIIHLAIIAMLLVNCGRTSAPEPNDEMTTAGGTGGSDETGGTTATGGASLNETGGSAAGGEPALGGDGGEGGLPLCEPLGSPLPDVSEKLKLSGFYWYDIDLDTGRDYYDGAVITGPIADGTVTFDWPEPLVSFQIEANTPSLRRLFTEGEELRMRFQMASYWPLFAELRRTDGSLVAFIHAGRFEPELIAALDLPISWTLTPWCQNDGSTNASESLNLHTRLGAMDTELSAYEEQQFELDGRPMMLTVHYAATIGDCSTEACSLINRAAGPNLDAQLIVLE